MTALTEADVVVTTRRSPSPEIEARASEIAGRLGRPVVPRRHASISYLVKRYGVRAALVVGDHRVRLVCDGRSYGFHPNMALHRVTSLGAGRGDRMVSVADLRPGDRFLDCTCGLGADAIVAAHAVGSHGAVLAIESSAVLATIVAHDLAHYRHPLETLVRAMRRVDVREADHVAMLASQPADSWDVVYLDPMFETPIEGGQGLDLVRLLGSNVRPDRAVVAEARRVARRCVVVKDRAPGELLAQLGIPVVSKTQRVWFGRVDG